MPLVSIVLVTYNRPDDLRRTLASLTAQTFGDFEAYICDDASPDPFTRPLCEEFCALDFRFRYIRQAVNVGMPANLNMGISACRGKYIANLHDGDIYSPQLLTRWVSALEECPGAGLVFNRYHGLDRRGAIANDWHVKLGPCFPGSALAELFFARWRFDSPVWGTVMVPAAVYSALGLFDVRHGFFADVAKWIQVAEVYKVAYVNEALISLPSRTVQPRQIPGSEWAHKRQVWAIHWQAHLRSGDRRLQRQVRHLGHLAFDALVTSFLASRRALQRRFSRNAL